jgi:polar amino acid transport system substrate-binding protein
MHTFLPSAAWPESSRGSGLPHPLFSVLATANDPSEMSSALLRLLTFGLIAFFAGLTVWSSAVRAQNLTVSTVTRPPFSMVENGQETGFSIELLAIVADRLAWRYQTVRVDKFSDMLGSVESGQADLAVANISITADREARMDFSQPIFESGLQIMIPAGDSGNPSLLAALYSTDLLAAIGIAFVLLLTGGMLMWRFERRAQPYFDRPLSEAWFPSFWWALNLVVNGGFEERMPRTVFGRMFGVLLVLSSLFVVSIFVAKITTAMTVEAISGSINSVNDLYGEQVGTISGSTSAAFLDRRDIDYRGFEGLDAMLAAFESGAIRVVVFDAPILSYYTTHAGSEIGRMTGPVFLRENYGIVFPSGSPLAEDVNRVLLALREDGTYEDLRRKWFGKGS